MENVIGDNMLNLRDIIKINNDDFIVISKVTLDNKDYFYLANTNKNNEFKYCTVNDDYLVEINDSNLLQKLIPMFTDQAMMELNNYMKNA